MHESESTIVFVDDSSILQKSVKRTLNNAGYQVVTASTGAQCLNDKEVPQKFDLLIVDLGLPDIGGNELADLLYERGRTNSVLYISGQELTDTAELRKSAFKLAVLEKPFSSHDLLKCVASLLEISQ